MPSKTPKEKSAYVERWAGRSCSIIRFVRVDGTPGAKATVVVVGSRSSAHDQLVDVLAHSTMLVLQIDSIESLEHVMEAFAVDAVVLSAEIPRLRIASLVDSMKSRAARPKVFALVGHDPDGAWLSHFGVTSVPQWSDWDNIRTAVLRGLECST